MIPYTFILQSNCIHLARPSPRSIFPCLIICIDFFKISNEESMKRRKIVKRRLSLKTEQEKRGNPYKQEEAKKIRKL